MILTGQPRLSGAFSGRQVLCGIAGSAAAGALHHAPTRSNAAAASAIPRMTPGCAEPDDATFWERIGLLSPAVEPLLFRRIRSAAPRSTKRPPTIDGRS